MREKNNCQNPSLLNLIPRRYAHYRASIIWYGLCVIFGITIAYVSLPPQSKINTWVATFWMFDYSSGFVKRGLIGQLISATSIEKIDELATLLFYILSFILSIFCAAVYRNTRLLAFSILLSGFSIQQFAYSLGFFDQINYILSLLSMLILLRWNGIWTYGIVFTFSVIMLLTHEAAALLIIPTLVSCLLIKDQTNGILISRKTLIYLLLIIFVFILILVFGKLDENNRVSLYNSINYALHGNHSKNSTLMEFATHVSTRSLSDNLNLTLQRWQSGKVATRVLLILLVSVPSIIILIKGYKKISGINKHYFWSSLIPVAGIVPMYVIGYDFFRWTAILFLNMFLLLGFILTVSKQHIELSTKHYIFWIILSLYSGAWGIDRALPDRMHLLESIIYRIDQT